MTETRWWKYMQSLMNGQSQLDAAKQIGISKSNITRWKDGARAAPDFVVKVARAYGANVLEALVEAEFITEQEANFTTSYTERDMLRWLRDSALNADAAAIQLTNITQQLEERFRDELSVERSNVHQLHVGDMDDDEAAVREANELRGAAQKRTPRLDEPADP